MTQLADISHSLSAAELKAIYDDNAEPFASIEQCQVFLRVASILRRREPEEIERAGDRLKTRDIEKGMAEARKALAVFQMQSRAQVHIVPGPLREGH